MLSNALSDDLKLKLYSASSPELILDLIFVCGYTVLTKQKTTGIAKRKNFLINCLGKLKGIILIGKEIKIIIKNLRLQFSFFSIEYSIAALTNSLNKGCALVAL